MGRGYSATALVCFCALSFLTGRFVQEIPGLPQTKTGVGATLQECTACAWNYAPILSK